MTRQAVTKHLAVLEEANLVSWKRRGREKLHCTMEIEPAGEGVKLTVTHTIERAGSKVIDAVSGG